MLVGTLRLCVRLSRCFVESYYRMACVASIPARVRQLKWIGEMLAKQANYRTVFENEFLTQLTVRFLSHQ